MFAQKKTTRIALQSLKMLVAITMLMFITAISARAIDDTTVAASYDVNGTAGADTITIQNGPIVSGFQTIQIIVGATTYNLANKTTINVFGLAGADSVTVNVTTTPDGVSTLKIDIEETTNDVIEVFDLNMPGDTVILTSQAIADGNGANVNNITAANLAIRAGVGSAGGVGNTITAFGTTVSTLAFDLTGGTIINIKNTGDLAIGTVDGLTASLGGPDARLASTGSLTINHNVSATSLGLSTPDLAAAGQDIVISNGVTVTGSTTIAIEAGDNFTLQGTAVLTSPVVCNCTIGLDGPNLDAGTPSIVQLNGTISSGSTWIITGNTDNDSFTVDKLGGGSLQMTGNVGNDSYTLNLGTITAGTQIAITEPTANGTDTLTMNGSSAADTFAIGGTNPAQAPYDITVARTGSPKVVYDPAAVENVTINGGDGGDSYTHSPTSTTSTVSIADSGASGTDQVSVTGTLAANTYTITSTQVARSPETINYSGIEQLTVNGSSGDDTFNVKASPTTTYFINGGAQTFMDVLNYDAEGRFAARVPPAADGAIVSPPMQNVNFTGIETVNINNLGVAAPPVQRSWTTTGDASVTEDESNPARPTYTNFTAAANAGSPAGTYTLRYNIQATDGLTGVGVNTRLRVRFRDEGAGSRVTVAIIRSPITGGATTIGTLFDSDAYAPGSGFQTQEIVMPALVFDFAQNTYWLEVTMTKAATSNQPGFGSAQITQQ